MAETKYTITVTGEPFLRPGATLTIETTETNFEKVLDDLLHKTYDLSHLIGTLEKFSEAAKDLKKATESWQEDNAKYRKDLQSLKTETQGIANDEKCIDVTEGLIKKGGVNPMPAIPRPVEPPKGASHDKNER